MKNRSDKLTRSIFSIRNSVIFGGTVIASAFFYKVSGSFREPLILGIIMFLFSVFYALAFERGSKDREEEYGMNNINQLFKVNDSLTPVIKKIVLSLRNLKKKSSENARFMIVERFMEDIVNFEHMIPKLVNSYRKAYGFVRGKDVLISNEIKNIQYKLQRSEGEKAKDIYNKALDEKKQTLEEIKEIKNTLDECESKLYFILSSLQKIETIIEGSELKDMASEEDNENISQQMEIFSESIRDVVKLMKL